MDIGVHSMKDMPAVDQITEVICFMKGWTIQMYLSQTRAKH